MNHDLWTGIAAGIVLRDFWCWGVAKIRCDLAARKAERQRAAARAEYERKREAARQERVAEAAASLDSIPFVVEVRNDGDFLVAVRKVHRSLGAADSDRFFTSPNGWEH